MAAHLKRIKENQFSVLWQVWDHHHLPLLFHTLKITQSQFSSAMPICKWLSAELGTGQNKETSHVLFHWLRTERKGLLLLASLEEVEITWIT